jgi:hypothetical protein
MYCITKGAKMSDARPEVYDAARMAEARKYIEAFDTIKPGWWEDLPIQNMYVMLDGQDFSHEVRDIIADRQLLSLLRRGLEDRRVEKELAERRALCLA